MINCREAEKAVICIQKQQVWKSSLEKVCRNWVFLQNFYCFFQQIMKLEVIYGQNLKLVTCNALPATLCDSVLKIPAHSDKSFVFWQRLHRHYCHQLFHELLLRFRHLHLSGLHVTQARHPYQRRGHWRYVTSTADAVAPKTENDSKQMWVNRRCTNVCCGWGYSFGIFSAKITKILYILHSFAPF